GGRGGEIAFALLPALAETRTAWRRSRVTRCRLPFSPARTGSADEVRRRVAGRARIPLLPRRGAASRSRPARRPDGPRGAVAARHLPDAGSLRGPAGGGR